MSRASIYLNPVNKGGSLRYEVLLKVRNREGNQICVKSPIMFEVGVAFNEEVRKRLRLFLERVSGGNTFDKYKVDDSKAWFYGAYIDF